MQKLYRAALCLLLLFGCAAPCRAAQNEALAVKVGFFAFSGYHETSESGVLSGYGYEILQHLAGYGGLRYEYLGYDKSWSQMQEMLANGEIDLLTSAQKTPEREKLFDFSRTNIGVSSAILTVKAGDARFMEADYTHWNGIRVGMIEGNSRNDSFAAYARENGFRYVPIYFGDTDAMLAELKSDGPDRSIDAVLTSNLRKTDGEWILSQFDSSPFYVMVKKGDAALLERVNDAIDQMDLCEPGLRTRLMNKYYAADGGGAIALTAEERAFVEASKDKSFTALINPDRAPYSYYENGALTGIAYEAAREIISRSGLNIRFVEAKDPKAYLAAADAGEADVRFEIADNYSRAEAAGYWLTVPFIEVPMAKLYNERTHSFATAAEPANRDMSGDYPARLRGMGLDPSYYASVSEVVDAVLSRRKDMAYLPTDSANMAIRNDVTNRLVCEDAFGLNTSYAVAVKNTGSPLLFSILNKAAFSIGEDDVDAIRRHYSANLVKPFTLIGYFYDYPIHVILFVAAILGIAILVIVVTAQVRRRRAERAHLEKERAQNELLKDALATAEKAGAAKSQFLSRVSHEMRTPLNAIIGFIELSKGADREQMESYLASSDLAAKQLLSVINDVLDMSSIESGKLKIADAPFNFKRLISSVTNIYGAQCRQKGVDFETMIRSPIDDWLVGDELRVNQILMNLLGNAVKFTERGHIYLTISQTAVQGEKLFLRFQLSDTGCGMSAELQKRLFQPFEQESASTARKYGGSGLGLSIVKNLVGLMSGSVRVDSAPGEGTTFTVDLPFTKSKLERAAALPKRVEALRVLAVDDEKDERAYIGAVLARMGVRYACVSGGAEALEALEASEKENDLYKLCLIDWRMPGLDGAATTRSIREKYGNDLILIVVSAYDFQQAGESAKAAGANLFLSKPLFQSSLSDLLMTLTGGGIAEAKEEKKSWDFAGKRVLLAEDNRLNQIVAKGYLSKYKLSVDLAENGRIAVDKFTSSPPGYFDTILMDIQMPVMDGFEATRAIRQSSHPEAGTVPIIAQTADAFNEDVAKALSAGMNAHVAKPIKPDVLAKALDSAFAAGRAAPSGGNKND